MSTLVSGTVASINARPGQQVRKGDVLLTLDDTSFNASLRAANAKVKRLGEATKEAKREWERNQEMYERTLLSNHDLEVARIEYVSLESQYQEARAERELRSIDLDNSRIRAPFDGVILARQAEVGQTVIASDQPVTLLSMAGTGEYLAQADVDRDTAMAVSSGQTVVVTVNGSEYPGTIRNPGLEPVAGTAKYRLDAVFKIGDKIILRAGSPATIRLP
jgi:multidrug efflux system membrane fusion protein